MLLDSDGKAATIAATAARYPQVRAFVETGTAIGDLPLRCAGRFDRIVTIEADDDYYTSAVHRLADFEHVHVVHGDSGQMLGQVLDDIAQPCVIWLDAHEIADDGHAAMVAELEHITAAVEQGVRHVVLVDDARLCRGRKGWSTLPELEQWAAGHAYSYQVADDIVRLLP